MKDNSSDIARFVQSEVDRLISKGLLLGGDVEPEFKRKIIEILINGAQGMFRWVQMSLEALKQTECQPDCDATLGKLPSDLSDLYSIIHEQICRVGPHGRDIATKTLKWLICAQRLLSVEEILAAVYEYDGSEQLRSRENEVLRLCRNLVVFDSEKRLVRFAHQSVREFLLNLPEYKAAGPHILATERCLDVYLPPESSTARVVERQNRILKRYAQVYWPVHYKYVEDSNTREDEERELRYTGKFGGRSLPYVQWIFDILKLYPEVHRSVHLKYTESFEASRLWKKVSRFAGRAHENSPPYTRWISDLCSYHKPHNAWQANIDLGLDEMDTLGFKIHSIAQQDVTLSAVASVFGISSFLRGLKLPGTAVSDLLLLAVEYGHSHVVHLLLDSGADINVQNKEGCTVLQLASSENHM